MCCRTLNIFRRLFQKICKILKLKNPSTDWKIEDIIQTEANLSYDLFCNILFILNIKHSADHYTFINRKPANKKGVSKRKIETEYKDFLEVRNKFSHGDIFDRDLNLKPEDYELYKDMILQLIRCFCDDIMNVVVDGKYINS